MAFNAFVRQLAGGTDAELLGRFIVNRDESAFAALVGRFTPTVLGTCQRVLGHTQDAEDAAQAVFLLLARNADRVRHPAVLGAWLHGVAVRVARKARGRRRPLRPLSDSTPAPPAPSWEDARRVIDEALAALPERLRAPLVLCYLEGLTRDEAASRLGWSLTTLRGRLERGREKLRAGLARRGFPLAAGLLPVLLDAPASASPGWTVRTTAVAVGAAPPPPGVTLMASGGVSMITRLAFMFAVLTVGIAAAGWYYAEPPGPDAVAPSKPLARALTPDPHAGPPDEALVGVWRAMQSGDGAVRTETLRFVDGKHLVWQVRVRSPGLDASSTLRGQYELKGGVLTYEVTDRWAGEESLPVRSADALRKYQIAWATDRTGFELKNADNKTVKKFTKWKDEKPAESVPPALKNVKRTIRKEPKYTGAPRYLLLALGAEGTFPVWLVVDGTALYVDRNGNGDLTDAGEKFPRPDNKNGKPRQLNFDGIKLSEPNGTTHQIELLSLLHLESGSVVGKLVVQANRGPRRLAGPTDLFLSTETQAAQVLHFGATEIVCRPSALVPSCLDAAALAEFRVQVGTPGIGTGSFVSYLNDLLPKGLGPVAEIEFEPLQAGVKPLTTSIQLANRDAGDQFFARVPVPDGVKTGISAAKVTLSFPNCPWGQVTPTTHRIDIKPKQN